MGIRSIPQGPVLSPGRRNAQFISRNIFNSVFMNYAARQISRADQDWSYLLDFLKWSDLVTYLNSWDIPDADWKECFVAGGKPLDEDRLINDLSWAYQGLWPVNYFESPPEFRNKFDEGQKVDDGQAANEQRKGQILFLGNKLMKVCGKEPKVAVCIN